MKDLKKLNGRELALHHAWFMDGLEKLPPGTKISPAKEKEKLAYEKELRRRLEDNLIGDVLPVRPTVRQLIDGAKTIRNKPIGALIPFNFEVFSEINTRIGRFRIEATSKDEAWKKARKKAAKYQGQASLKIS